MSGRLRNCSIRNYLYLAVLVFVWVLRPCAASVIVYVITPDGIVIGEDGQGLVPINCGFVGPPSIATMRKIFLLKGSLALGNIGLGTVKTKDGYGILYDLPSFTESINQMLDSNATVDSLVRIVEKESPETLSFLPSLFSQPNVACNVGENKALPDIVTTYVIAGYEARAPVIYKVELKIDREKNRVSPLRVLVEPPEGQQIDARTGGFNIDLAPLELVCNARADSYKIAGVRFPSQRKTFCAGDFRAVTLEQASDMVRMHLEIYCEIEPWYMGLPLTIITIPKGGKGWVRTYSKPFPSLPDGKSKRHKENNK